MNILKSISEAVKSPGTLKECSSHHVFDFLIKNSYVQAEFGRFISDYRIGKTFFLFLRRNPEFSSVFIYSLLRLGKEQ